MTGIAKDNVPVNSEGDRYRWRATAYYRTEAGTADVVFWIDELEDLHELIERGPNWDALIKIDIRLAYHLMPGLTVEEAARL